MNVLSKLIFTQKWEKIGNIKFASALRTSHQAFVSGGYILILNLTSGSFPPGLCLLTGLSLLLGA